MKLTSLLIGFCFLTFGSLAQNTLIVDNNFNAPTGTHVYSTLQAASDAAQDGDTIQVQPSPNAYGDVIIRKQITLIGIGFNVQKDISYESVIGNITLSNNADNTTDASGTVITGVRMGGVYLGTRTGAGYVLSDVKIFNNIMAWIYQTTGYVDTENLEIFDNYLTSNITNNSSIYLARRTNNALIRNNLIRYAINFASTTPGTNTVTNNLLYGRVRVAAVGTNTNIINNNFIGAANTSYAFETTLRDCIVSYNIFFGVTPSISAGGSTSDNFQRNVFTFNLLHATGDDVWPPQGGTGGNTGDYNYMGSPEFTDVQLLSSWSSAYDFTLISTSPALLANIPEPSALFDIGFTGGAYPWTESNMTFQPSALPVIEILNTSTIINPGDNLPVRVKATSN